MKGRQYRRLLFECSDQVTEQIERAKAYQTSYCNIFLNNFDQAIENLQLCLFLYDCLRMVKRLFFYYVFCIHQKLTKCLEQI